MCLCLNKCLFLEKHKKYFLPASELALYFCLDEGMWLICYLGLCLGQHHLERLGKQSESNLEKHLTATGADKVNMLK